MEMVGLLGALLLWSWGFAATAQAQPATLTLACKGTVTNGSDPEKQSVSMGLIVDFNNRTVQGFGYPGLVDIPVKITAANEATVAFGGAQKLFGGSQQISIMGTVDRVAGDVESTTIDMDQKSNQIISQTSYALQCRPTQRMF